MLYSIQESSSVEQRKQLLEAIRYLYEHYEEIWEDYMEGNHIRRYIKFLKRLSELKYSRGGSNG